MNARQMLDRIREGRGFIAALDQSGGSTSRTLVRYGHSPDEWPDEPAMFELIHRMRCRILTSPAFSSDKVLAVILFERTMEGFVASERVPALLRAKGIAAFLKIDQGLEAEKHGVQLMKPIAGLESRLARARELGVLGTKMRSFIRSADPAGIRAVVAQQFALAERICAVGLLPILEPEYDVAANDRQAGEAILRRELVRGLAELPGNHLVVLKLSIPVEANAYLELAGHPRVARLAALSGGYSRAKACAELARNDRIIASFSRALLEDLRVWMSDREFDAALAQAITEIYCASAHAST